MRKGWQAFAVYAVLALATTWPLARGLHRDVAWDLGDSLLVMWALAWDCQQILAILSGETSAVGRFFDANIFHPAPLALAYSEHFLAQAIQVLPIYALTHNAILSYNLLLLSTIALSGLGTYLLVRSLTGNAWAGFVAGLLFAFAPYRVPQSSHLQVLSSQWMPFVLYGLHRYFAERRLRALLGASLALTAQNLSCGYYLLYFAPFAAAFAVWEMVRLGLWRVGRAWAHLALAASVVLVLTVPLLVPYARLKASLGFERGRAEVVRYSADVYSYATTFAEQAVWGTKVRAFPKPEGDLFPGAVPLLLASIGLVWWRPTGRQGTEAAPAPRAARPRIVPVLLLAAAGLHALAALWVLIERRVVIDLGVVDLRMSNVTQLVLRSTVCGLILLAISSRARERVAAFSSARGFFLLALVAAAWLSLGPVPQTAGRPLDLVSPYGWLYNHVPGFDGVRAPARFGMLVALMLAVLGGWGAAVIARWRGAPVLLSLVSMAFVAESGVRPYIINGSSPADGYRDLVPRVHPPTSAPRVYHRLADEPLDAVLLELPIGDPSYDLRAVYYSTVHWRRLVNGYSGFFPPHYPPLALALSDVARHPDVAWEGLRGSGATHVVVHEGAFIDGGPRTTAVLRDRGAVEIFRDGTDVLLRLP